jgi:hypothetical protein
LTRRLLLLAALATLAGCGTGVQKGTPPPTSSSVKVALLAAPKRSGEVIVRGEVSPGSHGPFTFDGRYRVRFEQFAPEDPKLDFTDQTSFVAAADRRAEEDGDGSVRLFSDASRTGSKTVTLHGRYFVDVTFGDFPYVIRITPLR